MALVTPFIVKKKQRSVQEFGGMRSIAKALSSPDCGGGDGLFIPFSGEDATAGAENELQTVIIGDRRDVDLPLSIRHSNFFENIRKRTLSGDTPPKTLETFERFLDNNPDNVWENSWVRFPYDRLGPYAREIFSKDLLSDKTDPVGPCRCDADRFILEKEGGSWLRVPVSYLFKLALADAIGSESAPPAVRDLGNRFLAHFLNDNTSPETFSFFPVSLTRRMGMGRELAKETAKRFLLCQMLTMYAGQKFGLFENGQEPVVYFAPHPHIRQKALNDMIPDSFYRELFMSPCLSGWNKGEEKFRYMVLCHQTLSRSQLNAVKKLKEAGIITNNLVVLPNLSNISLANNGTHISLGSRRLTALSEDPSSGFGPLQEKYAGDLCIKIVEHFLPLFVGAYSAAPYRLEFSDFHPEKALGFLPHELDFTHLRMIWRRWKKKARLKFLGHPVTPFGPEWLDRLISTVLRFKGDFVQDFRVVDYLVCLMSTEQSPALDGGPDSEDRLKKDLATFGVFDEKMALYLLYRLRRHSQMGFSGFEGRHYSLFESLTGDMAGATDLQTLLTALAYKYALTEKVTHADIPDTPCVESERRQIFFGAAIGIPTFFVKKDTRNRLLRRILQKARRTRMSHRYTGYIRVYNIEYRRALLAVLREDAADLVDMMGLHRLLDDLEARIDNAADCSAAGKLTNGILATTGAKSPLDLKSADFNMAAERYYRNDLRRRHIEEAFLLLESDAVQMDRTALLDERYRAPLNSILKDRGVCDFLSDIREDFLNGAASEDDLVKLIRLILLSFQNDMRRTASADPETAFHDLAN